MEHDRIQSILDKVDQILKTVREIDAALDDTKLKAIRPPAADDGDKEMRPLPRNFADTCYMLHQHPECKEEWKKPLKDWMKYSNFSKKQRKFFAVIYKGCMGVWPTDDVTVATEGTPGAAMPVISSYDPDREVPF